MLEENFDCFMRYCWNAMSQCLSIDADIVRTVSCWQLVVLFSAAVSKH